MTDLLSFPLPVLFILLGLFSLFLSIGGRIGNTVAPPGKETLIGIVGGLLLIGGALLIYSQTRVKPEVLSPTPIAEVPETESTPTPIPSATLVSNTPTSIQTETAVPPTKTSTNTPIPEIKPQVTETPIPPTATPLPTNTPTTEPTPEPEIELSDEIIQIVSVKGDNWIYAGPDTINERLGAMQLDENGIVLGKDKWDNWVKVKTDREVTGWVVLEKVEFVTGTLEEVAVAWPLNRTSIDTPTTTTDNTQCMMVSLAFQDWPSKDFDDIWIRWSNVPNDANRVHIWVNGSVNNENLPLIYPTYSDIKESEYYIGYWKFIERGFLTNVTFTYTLQAISENNDTICTVNGTFEQ